MDTANPTLKGFLTTWRDAVSAHGDGRYNDVIDAYRAIPETSARMHYNVACAYMKLNNIEQAIQHLSEAVQVDSHLAIAFFQRGGLYLKSKRPDDAARDFDNAYTLLRGNTHIDYKPLGLFVRLLMSEVLYNRAMCQLQLGDVEAARTLLKEALYCTDAVKADQLRSALNFLEELAPEMVSPLQKSADRVFSPPKTVMDNLEKRTMVGKAKVVATNSSSGAEPMPKAERRVKELLFVPKPRPPSSPGAVLRRFLKTPPRARSKSTADLRFSADMTPSTAFQRKKSNGLLRKNKSASDLPQTRDRSRSEGAVFLKPMDRLTPTSPVRGFDILTFTPSNEEIHVPTTPEMNKRKSLGNVFGNYSTVVKMGLSLSCDMLTAFVTPCSSDCDSSSLHSDTISDLSADDRPYDGEDEAGEITIRVPSLGSSDADVRGSLVSEDSTDSSVFRESSARQMSYQEETLAEEDEGEITIHTPSDDGSNADERVNVSNEDAGEVSRKSSTSVSSDQDSATAENPDSTDGVHEIKARNWCWAESEVELEAEKEVHTVCSVEKPTVSTSTASLAAVAIETTRRLRPPPPSYPPPPLPKEVKQSLYV